MTKLRGDIPQEQLREEYKLDQLVRISELEEHGEITFAEAKRRRGDLEKDLIDTVF